MLVDATDLDQWANRRDAQGTLPKLIRRLVMETAPGVQQVSFRADEGVQLSGWDGVVVSKQDHAFVPAGISGWEISVNKDVEQKANEDYKKRTENPSGMDPKDATFIFVTLRRWPGKERWAQARLAEGKWHDIRAYDADDLETWLESAPCTHIWVSTLLGKRPPDAVDLETFWEDWSKSTHPPTPPSLVLAGRKDAVDRIHSWLHADPSPLALQAESREEAIAVFASALQTLPDEERDAATLRAAIIRSEDAWYHLATSRAPLILVIEFESSTAVTHAMRHGHWVLIPLGREHTASPKTVIVPSLSVKEATEALKEAGIPKDRARDLAALARRSLSAFRRKLALNPKIQQPTWARPEHGKALLPAMLAGAWNEECDGDREALATLGGTSYEEIRDTLVRWENESDSPVRRVGNVWYVVSREDAWRLLARYLVPDDLKRLKEVVLQVLGTPDPRFDLPESQRYMAQVLRKVTQWSSLLCRSFAEGLAVMATSSETARLPLTPSPADIAAIITDELLQRANTDWRIWASLSEWGALRLLAEAAPDVFLRAVDRGLSGEEPPILKLFAKDDADIFVSSPHTGLLWALETLAWSREHLGYASRLLAKLARMDPGGKLLNRPINSLRTIFLPYFPQTSASPEERLCVLDMLRREEPHIAWRLMVKLLPRPHDSTSPTAKPQWRKWEPDPQPEVSWNEYFEVIREIAMRLLEDAGKDGHRWKDLVEALPNLPLNLRNEVVKHLNGLDSATLTDEDRSVVWHTLRQLLSRHRSHPDAKWALPAEELQQLNSIMQRFEPDSLQQRFGWLFGHHVELPEGRDADWEAYVKKINQRRIEAINRVYKEGGLAALLSLAEVAERPDSVGFAFAQIDAEESEEDSVLSTYLAADNLRHAEFARGFACGRIFKQGLKWAEGKLKEVGQCWTSEQQAELLACLPTDPETWELARSLGTETERCYWQLVQPYGINEAYVEQAARCFLKYNRPHAAVRLLAHHSSASPLLIADALEALLNSPPPKQKQLAGYELGELLDRLQASEEIERSRVAKLEWAFLPLLRHHRRPRILHEELAKNPKFFVEVVSLVYRAEGEEPAPISEEDQVRARLGYELLNSWRSIPGDCSDDTVDAEKLSAWVKQARELLKAKGRRKIGDVIIGQMLSGSPLGSDGVWPHEAVRDLIEEIASDDLERGIEVGLYNSRGVVTKAPYEGGSQERQIASRYERDAQAVANQWPRTAAMLRRIAAKYRAEAKREDRTAELEQELGF